MFERFPRLILAENRKALSMSEARMWIKLAIEQKKLCLFGLYAFEEWRNGIPKPESVVLDVVAYIGDKKVLENLASRFLQERKQSLFIFDGKDYILIVEHDGTPLEKIKEPVGTKIIRDVYFKFTYPNTMNGRTGKNAELIRRYKVC